MLHEGRHAFYLSGFDEPTNLSNLIVQQRDGDLGCCHTKNITATRPLLSEPHRDAAKIAPKWVHANEC